MSLLDEDLNTPVEADSNDVSHTQKPEDIPEQFWDKKTGSVNTEGLAKSYKELRNQFNERNNDKPGKSIEDYATEDFLADNPDIPPALLMRALETAKEVGLGVKQTQEFIKTAVESGIIPEPYSEQTELAKLGKGGVNMIDTVGTWLHGLGRNGTLGPDELKSLVGLGRTADGIRTLDALRRQSMEMPIPTGSEVGTYSMTKAEWYVATYETHGLGGESRDAYNQRMHNEGLKFFKD